MLHLDLASQICLPTPSPGWPRLLYILKYVHSLYGLGYVFRPCFLLCVCDSFIIILCRKHKRVDLLKYIFCFNVTVCVSCLFLIVLWVSLQAMIEKCLDHFHMFSRILSFFACVSS